MKWNATNIIALLGFALLFIAFAGGIVVAALFIFPGRSFMGVTAVNERDTEIVYRDPDLVAAFATGNFLIESENCRVEVVMMSSTSDVQGTIGVKESATGIAFNSRSRTLVEWTQILVGGEPYFKLKVLEPNGVVFSNDPTTVYLNLPSTTQTFNFILDNHDSSVNFTFGDLTQNSTSELHVGSLVVKSALAVSLPASYALLDIRDVVLDCDRTEFTCEAPVTGDVTVNGSGGKQTFENIDGTVNVHGNNNLFRADTVGNVTFDNRNGSLGLFYANSVNVTTETADVTVNEVANGVTMTTAVGNLVVGSINQGGLNFTASLEGSVTVNNKLVGDVVVVNRGLGNITLGSSSGGGVEGNVDIESSEIGGGNIAVTFKGDQPYAVKIRGYDGNITVDNINGWTDIQVREPGTGGAAGKAILRVSFRKVTNDDNILVAGGYGNDSVGWGDITVQLAAHCNAFDLYLLAANSAIYNGEPLAHTGAGEAGRNPIAGDNSGSGRLTIFALADLVVEQKN